jgi:acyl carrier protein
VCSLSNEQKTFLRKFISSLIDDQSRQLNDSDSLVQSRLIDSINIAQIVIFLEENHSITLKDEDLVPETFETLNGLFSVIEKQKGR